MVLGDFSSRILLQGCGYVWPAYQCYKAIEQKKDEATREWCIYWFILAIFATVESIVDAFAWWVPMYYTAKVGFVIYLWHPKTKGALSLYNNTVQPLLRKHEAVIDLKVEESRAYLGDAVTANFKWVLALMQSKAGYAVAQLQQLQARGPGSGPVNLNWPSSLHAAETVAVKAADSVSASPASPKSPARQKGA